MKKTIAILLVAVLAMCSVFAEIALGGEAKVAFTGDFDKKSAAFDNTSKAKLTLDANSASKVYEGDIYAGIKATLEFEIGKALTSASVNAAPTGVEDAIKTESADFLKVKKFKIDEAYITDGNWKVSILSAAATPTFAKGWETAKSGDDNKDVTLAVAVGKDIPGVTVEYAGWKVGAGLKATFKDGEKKEGMLTLATPSFTFDAVSVKAGAGAANKDGKLTVGGGVEAKYATDAFSATVAGDVVYGKVGNTFDAAVSAKVEVTPVTVDAFYAKSAKLYDKVATYADRYFTGAGDTKDYLSAKVAGSFAINEQPVTVTLVGLDLINKQYLDLEAKSTFSGVETYLNGGYEVKAKLTHLGVGASYTMDKVGKIYGGVGMSITTKVDSLKAKVGIENKTLVSGATLAAEYATGNLVAETDKFGKITASAKITF
ncbi:MAG: hypothetical protein SPE84_09725 [Bullifex sp.]|nr:hypothetical protein [Bullifex sp.]